MRKYCLLSVILLLGACSNRAIYDGIQSHNRAECAKQAQYEECIERSDKSYDEYERERQETTGE